jgi:WD repeat-containing protein 35
VRASTNSTGSIADGATVKVVKPIKVYHVPKHTDGLILEGMEGTVMGDVSQYKGKVLSANLKYKVQFNTEKDGAPLKFIAHLVSWLAA